MLKKTIIAAAIAGTAMLTTAGGGNAAIGSTSPSAVTAIQMAIESTPQASIIKIGHKRKFKRHHRRWHRWHHKRNWHFTPRHHCHWFKRKARWTGSHYWWKRYHACRHDFHINF